MIKVSASGKVIVSGEHSIVWGEPALLAAIDKRCWVEVKDDQGKIRIIDEALGERQEVGFNEVLAFAGEGKKGGGEHFKQPKKDPLGLVKVGIGEVLSSLGVPREGFEIRIKNEVPIGCGLGSSAAMSVSVVAGLWKFFNTKQEKLPFSLINKIALEVERRQHGNPSGGDNTVCTYGGLLVFKKRNGEGWFEQLNEIGSWSLPQFLLVDTGKPQETTGEMVGMIELRIKNKELRIKNLMAKMGRVTGEIIKIFRTGEFSQLKRLIRENERLLEELGAVGERAKKLIQLIEQGGGAAKICGAGGAIGGSGMALVYHHDWSTLKRRLKNNKIGFLKVKLGGSGVTIH